MIQARLLDWTPHLNFGGTQESCTTSDYGSEDDITVWFRQRNASTKGNDPGYPDPSLTSAGHQTENEQTITSNSIDAEVDRLWTKAPPPAFPCPSLWTISNHIKKDANIQYPTSVIRILTYPERPKPRRLISPAPWLPIGQSSIVKHHLCRQK